MENEEMNGKKEHLFTVSKKNCRFDYFKGHGAGGQKKNKTENYCRCTHEPSRAVGLGQEGRSKTKNQQLAFKRMGESKEFKLWVKMKVAEITGVKERIEKQVEYEIQNNTKIEVFQDGEWIECKH